MKAVILSSDRQIELTDVSMPQVQSGEVLIKSEFCGICGTDLHAPQLSGFRPPVVMGHEFAGEIVEVGPNVKSWWQGQRVAVNPNGNVCGKCESCRGGRYNTCHKAILEQSLGAQHDGGMANFVSVPTAHLHALPDEVDLCSAAWSEPLAVAVRAVRNSEVRFGDSVCVIGGGPIGLLVVQLARRAGASSIVLVEPSKLRREAGSAVGADLLFEPEELARAVEGGNLRPLDHVFECSGHRLALQTAIDVVAPGGTIRLVGASPEPLQFSAMSALVKEIRVSTNFLYMADFDIAIDLLARKQVDVASLTSNIVALDDYEQAFEALRLATAIKVMIRTGSM